MFQLLNESKLIPKFNDTSIVFIVRHHSDTKLRRASSIEEARGERQDESKQKQGKKNEKATVTVPSCSFTLIIVIIRLQISL